jgi:hypothetical protein
MAAQMTHTANDRWQNDRPIDATDRRTQCTVADRWQEEEFDAAADGNTMGSDFIKDNHRPTSHGRASVMLASPTAKH